LVSHLDPVSNDYMKFPSVDDIAKKDVEVDFFDIEHINSNLKEKENNLDDLDNRLFRFLDKERTYGNMISEV